MPALPQPATPPIPAPRPHLPRPRTDTLDAYLALHFLDEPQFADLCGLGVDRLQRLRARGLVPGPAYVVAAGELCSFPFGTRPAPGARSGRYYPPGYRPWYVRALALTATLGVADARDAMRRCFDERLRQALGALDRELWRLPDCFDAHGHPLAAGLHARSEQLWRHLLHGTFGVCVARPGSEAAIAEKEVLQEAVTALSDDGRRTQYTPAERTALRGLVARYADACLPFSPLEYASSSRLRLVDRLSARLGP